MTSDLLVIWTSIVLTVLAGTLIWALVMLNRSMQSLVGILGRFQDGLSPIVGDLAVISVNMAAASDGLRTSVQQVGRMTEAVGNIGGDLEQGRRAVKGGVELVGSLAALAAPWLSKWRK
jgi:hypothetical protein